MQAIIDADMQAGMDESSDQQAEAARQREETGWQWQGQRGRQAGMKQEEAGKQVETQAEAHASRHAEAVKRQAGKQVGRQRGRQASREVGIEAGSQAETGTSTYQYAGRQESVRWQGQAEERGRPAEAGRQAGGRQAEMGGTGTHGR
jgi:hypothetical protein